MNEWLNPFRGSFFIFLVKPFQNFSFNYLLRFGLSALCFLFLDFFKGFYPLLLRVVPLGFVYKNTKTNKRIFYHLLKLCNPNFNLKLLKYFSHFSGTKSRNVKAQGVVLCKRTNIRKGATLRNVKYTQSI